MHGALMRAGGCMHAWHTHEGRKQHACMHGALMRTGGSMHACMAHS